MPVRRSLAAWVVLPLLATACGADDPEPGGDQESAPSEVAPAAPTTLDTEAAEDLGDLAEDLAGQQEPTPKTGGAGLPDADLRVLAISVDGLRAAAIGVDATPAIHGLFARGAGTLNARTALDRTDTVPNHVCMVTGRPVSEEHDGHGVTWNDDTDQTVPAGVASVFDSVAEAGGTSAIVAGKAKLDILRDSWPGSVASFAVEPNMDRAADLAVAQLEAGRDLVFWHLAGPDQAGHGEGWGSAAYDAMVGHADAAVGEVIDAIADDPELLAGTVVVLTSDHGGVPGTEGHGDAESFENYAVPFVAWGAGVQAGDLYDLNPAYGDPATARPAYDGPQPVRNCDVANSVAGILGLPPVAGSSIGADPRLKLAD